MTFAFKPAGEFTERAGLFVSLVGGTNSGKTFSAMRLARGIAGPTGKIAVLDTEGGRTLHLKEQFQFDANVMQPEFRPERFSQAAIDAETAGYDALVIDSFSMEWVGLGGVLDWQAQELQRMAGDDFKKQQAMKGASWIRPKMAHKAMVYSLLQRRIPIIFSIRGEDTFKPGDNRAVFKPVCNAQFPYEVTVSFRLASDRKGYIDLSDPSKWKMEGPHAAIFKDGDRISEEHGAALAAWARGAAIPQHAPPPQGEVRPNPPRKLFAIAREKAGGGKAAFDEWRKKLKKEQDEALADIWEELQQLMAEADEDVPA